MHCGRLNAINTMVGRTRPLPGVSGPCQMPPSEQWGCPALLLWMNANEGVCVRLNVIHTTSNWARKEVQNWGWQPPKPKQPGRMSDVTWGEDTLHAWIIVAGEKIKPILTAVRERWKSEMENIYVNMHREKRRKKITKKNENVVGILAPIQFFKICLDSK